MDLHQSLLFIKGEDKSDQIRKCNYVKGNYQITYTNGRTYSYRKKDVLIYQDLKDIDIIQYILVKENQTISNITKALRFEKHIRIFYKTGYKEVMPVEHIRLIRSCLQDNRSRDIFEYLKQLAGVISLKSVDGTNILTNHYNKIDFIREDSVLAAFMNPAKIVDSPVPSEDLCLFPFGFNASQKQAVNNGLKDKISIIEGPPGTGKTQTILNLIANIVMSGQTVAVVSGNNSATSNILEKLVKYDLSFLVASLGSSMNKEDFINRQEALPNLTDWQISTEQQRSMEEQLVKLGKELDQMLLKKNRLSELRSELIQIETEKRYFDEYYVETYASMRLFKSKLMERYGSGGYRKPYELNDLWKNSRTFLRDFPVVLSTTYSLRSSLSSKVTYDYLIIDEASQVDLVTGALAFSCANRAIVVGDQMQLPNVVSEHMAVITDAIYQKFILSEAYQFSTNSLLSASVKLFDRAPHTLLREHYRCHPKIIGFCNQKFYANQLIVLTESRTKDHPLKAYKTVEGNHARGNINIREIDVIMEQLIPNEQLDVHQGSIGIISPYNKQVDALKQRTKGTSIEVATVHKYQGREKDSIILTTVDNEISEFTDTPNLLNVAVSRAVNQLFIVTSGNQDDRSTSINDLVNYIEYNNFEVVKSEIYSIFDYLYKSYAQQRSEMIKRMKLISKYDSDENLTG